MTGPGESGRPDGQARPPPRGRVSLKVLADLAAELLTEEEERQLRSRVARDPDAAELFAALDRVRIDLDGLDDEPVPDEVVAKLDLALAAEAAAEAGTGRGSGESTSPAISASASSGEVGVVTGAWLSSQDRTLEAVGRRWVTSCGMAVPHTSLYG